MMAGRLARLNMATREEAAAMFGNCCASRAWIEAMVDRRPYADTDRLFAEADRVWWYVGEPAWRDAFRGHPRIGESKTAAGVAAQWSAEEQSAAAQGDAGVRAELREAQREYEARFGHIFLICATGLTARQMLDALRARMNNDPATELRVAAEQQRRITRLRLEKMLTA